MSIAQLTSTPPRSPHARRIEEERERVFALITRLEDQDLGVAEEAISGILAHQQAGLRGLTVSELEELARIGVSEEELRTPSARTAITRGRLLEQDLERDTWTVSEVAAMLEVTAARIRQRCAAGTLIAQRRRDGWHLPRFQFPGDRELPGWSTIAQAIPVGTHLLAVERGLTTPMSRLQLDGADATIFAWLASGGEPGVASAALYDDLTLLP